MVSENLPEEVPRFVSGGCVLKSGNQTIPLGLGGMTRHLIDVKKTYPDYGMKTIRQYEDGDYVIF